jgi:hypothetical protein
MIPPDAPSFQVPNPIEFPSNPRQGLSRHTPHADSGLVGLVIEKLGMCCSNVPYGVVEINPSHESSQPPLR